MGARRPFFVVGVATVATAPHQKERQLQRDVARTVESALPGVEVLALELTGKERFCVYVDHPQGVGGARTDARGLQDGADGSPIGGHLDDLLDEIFGDASMAKPGLEVFQGAIRRRQRSMSIRATGPASSGSAGTTNGATAATTGSAATSCTSGTGSTGTTADGNGTGITGTTTRAAGGPIVRRGRSASRRKLLRCRAARLRPRHSRRPPRAPRDGRPRGRKRGTDR